MEAKITIRRAVATDAVDAAAAFTAAQESMAFFPKLHSEEEDQAFVRNFIANSETWVALSDARVIGLVSIDGDRLAHLYVDPLFHNRGIGAALLAQVKTQRPKGFDLWTFEANTGARRFYERHGFVAAEFTDGSRNDEKLADVRYAWAPVLES